jgi:hypothetical protein
MRKPEIKITLDRERVMRMDMNALATFNETTGKELFSVFVPGAEPSTSMIRAVVHALLSTDDPSLTLHQAGALINVMQLPELLEKMTAVVIAGAPEAKDPVNPTIEAAPVVAASPSTSASRGRARA